MRVTNTIPAITITLFLVLQAQADDWSIPSDPAKFHIFIFAGQSNMAGGFNDSHLYDDDGNYDPVTAPVPRVLQFKARKWIPAAHPLTRHVKTSFSLPLPFAEKYLAEIDDPDVKVGIYISAFGGKAMSFFTSGGAMHPGAAKSLPQYGTVKGFIWHQGESDNRMEERETYQAKLLGLVQNVRDYVGNPELPFVTGAFNPQWAYSNPYILPPAADAGAEVFNRYESQQTTLNILAHIGDTLNKAAHVHSTGAGHVTEHQRKLVDDGALTGETKRVREDKTHFNRHGYTTLGHRYAELILDRPAFKADPISLAAVPGRAIAFDLRTAACDISQDTLSFAAKDLPAWLQLSADGKMTGKPPTAGNTTVPVTVTDTSGGRNRSHLLIVASPAKPPVFRADNYSRRAAIPGQQYTDRVRYNYRKPQSSELHEANHDALTFSKVDGPTWISVQQDGTFVGTPPAADAGKLQTLTIQAADLDGADTARYSIAVLGADYLWHEAFDYVVDIRHRAVGEVLRFNKAMPTDTWFLKHGHFPAKPAEDYGFTDLTANLNPEAYKFGRGALNAMAIVVDRDRLAGRSGTVRLSLNLPAPESASKSGRGAGRRAKKNAGVDPKVLAGADAHFIVSLYQCVGLDSEGGGFEVVLVDRNSRGKPAQVSPTGGAVVTKLAEKNYRMTDTGEQTLEFEYDGRGDILLTLSASREATAFGGGRAFDDLSFRLMSARDFAE
jgi:hypothetical protein